jgi:hypothetical protein
MNVRAPWVGTFHFICRAAGAHCIFVPMNNLIGLLFFFPVFATAQYLPEPHYPQHYFRDPLDIPITLAGNFGELRYGHFHAGIDIKTGGREGLEVHAAAAGYISRITISSGGYGNLICITHPNGLVTLYGHLSRFFPELSDYIKKREYASKQWAISLDFSKEAFPVSKGQLIGWSGSTGDAAGPHLHFEIRNAVTDDALNPLLFGLEITDTEPPAIMKIAVYDRDRSVYEQQPQILKLKLVEGIYVPESGKILATGTHAGIGINAVDRQNGMHNIYGIYEAVLLRDGHPDIGVQLDNIGHEETRYVDAHVDYKTHFNGGPYFQLLFSLPGNHLPIYHDLAGNGDIDLSDGLIHEIRILVRDASGNTSTVQFELQHAAGIPIPADACMLPMAPGTVNRLDSSGVSLVLPAEALYDRICFEFAVLPDTDPRVYSDVYQLHSGEVPLYDYFTVRIKPDRDVPTRLLAKLVIVEQNSHQRDVQPASWQGEWLAANFRSFGRFQVQADAEPPIIRPVIPRKRRHAPVRSRISFKITDNLSGVQSYTAELDGQWLMFAQKGDLIWYDFDSHCPKGPHMLIITASDAVNNRSDYIFHFKR